MSDFVERLQEILADHNLTYQELAKQSGVPRQVLYGWIKYKIPPKPKSIIRLAQFFQCPVDFFIGRTEETKIKFSDNPIPFCDRLRQLIAEKKITPYRACMQLHIETDIMSVWLNKGTLPNFENLLMLTDYFGCSADYLLGLSDFK